MHVAARVDADAIAFGQCARAFRFATSRIAYLFTRARFATSSTMLGRRIQIDATFRARFLARCANAFACAANAVGGASLVAATAMLCAAARIHATRGTLDERAIALADTQPKLTELSSGAGIAAGAAMLGIRPGIDAGLVAQNELAGASFRTSSAGTIPSGARA